MYGDTPTNQAMTEELLRMVKEANGIKDKDLIYMMRKFVDKNFSDSEISNKIEELIKAKQLIAIEYSLDYTSVRNFLLPAKTSFIVRGQNESIHRI